MNVAEAKRVLRIDAANTANDALISSLVAALPSYIEVTTGMTPTDQIQEPIVETVSGFLLMLWYYSDHADDQKLQRTIDNLLKAITIKANASERLQA